MFVRMYKAVPLKRNEKYWYLKLFKAVNSNGVRKDEYHGSLGKFKFINGEVARAEKVKLIAKLMSNLAVSTAPNSEKVALLSDKRFTLSPIEKIKNKEFYQSYQLLKEHILKDEQPNTNAATIFSFLYPKKLLSPSALHDLDVLSLIWYTRRYIKNFTTEHLLKHQILTYKGRLTALKLEIDKKLNMLERQSPFKVR